MFLNGRSGLLCLCFFLVLAVSTSAEARRRARRFNGTDGAAHNRSAKFLSMFQVVRFPNEECSGGSKNGTCYTGGECSARGGVNGGACADGYGVCCVFTINCGGTSSENGTYVDSATAAPGGCSSTVCPANSDICQLRLDFDTFVLTGPSTASDSALLTLNGSPTFGGGGMVGKAVTLASRCLTDSFSVTGAAGGGAPAPICGTNTGEHMYVDLDRSLGCVTLNFNLGATAAAGTSPVNRQWSVRSIQLGCDSPWRAPPGCTQYFADASGAGVVKSFNFNGGQHLANQAQTICVRREQGSCRICWYAEDPKADFALSGMHNVAAMAGKGFTENEKCCNYGTNGDGTDGYDCLLIPGASREDDANVGGGGPNVSPTSARRLPNSVFCGRSAGLVTADNAATTGQAKTVCSTRTPFLIRFFSDDFEFHAKEAHAPNAGFKLKYRQDANNCPEIS